MRLGLGGLTVALALSAGSACKCGREEAQVVGASGGDVKGLPITPPPHETALPAVRPDDFSVSFRRNAQEDGETSQDLIRLSSKGAFQSSTRGRRKVRVAFSTNGPVLDKVYAKLREFACESVKTEPQRSNPHGGTMLQIGFGDTKYIVNDLQLYYPTAQWSGAYEGCTQAMNGAFPDPGESGYAELDVRFEDFKADTAASLAFDVGPDHRGIGWRDADMTATLYVARVRPVDVVIGAGKSARVVTIDLAEHSGVVVTVSSSAVNVEPNEGAARLKGNVGPGKNRRMQPLAAGDGADEKGAP